MKKDSNVIDQIFFYPITKLRGTDSQVLILVEEKG